MRGKLLLCPADAQCHADEYWRADANPYANAHGNKHGDANRDPDGDYHGTRLRDGPRLCTQRIMHRRLLRQSHADADAAELLHCRRRCRLP